MLSMKGPTEIVTVTFDFSNLTTSVSAPAVACSVSSGAADPNPAAFLLGLPQISGAKVLQQITLGQPNTFYELACTVTAADGVSRYALADVVPVFNL